MAEVYRTKSLDRLQSPEQLDQLVSVTSPKSWIALITAVVLVSAVVVWGFVGSIATRVVGSGILLTREGRVFDALAPAAGVLSELRVLPGERVEKGQEIAGISILDIEQRRDNAKEALAEQTGERKRIENRARQEVALKLQNLVLRKDNLKLQLQLNREQEAFLRAKLKDDEALLARSVVTRTQVEQSRAAYNRASEQVATGLNELANLDAQGLDLQQAMEGRITDAELAVSDARRRLSEVDAMMQRSSKVLAPATGRVTEVKASPGSLIQTGQPVLSLETEGTGLELLLYVPPEQGKRIEKGMDAQVSPSTAQREEFGTVIGKVRSVSDFPVTVEGMRSVLQNENLVRSFSAAGAPYAVRVELVADPQKAGGYAWSSDKGNAITLSSGTLCSAEIVVRSQMPASLVIPLLAEYTGLH